jgi:phosphate transport system substrate-binding protein
MVDSDDRRTPPMRRRMPVGSRTIVGRHMSERHVGRRKRVASVILAVLFGSFAALGPATLAAASPSLQVTGSSFAGVAIQQWVGQAETLYGLNINWQVSSSVIGLDNFAQNEIDFAASDIPYSSGQASSTPTIPYQYMPDVAGALAFMYNLLGNNGEKITNLVLDAHVLDDIFSGRITTWNDSEITELNPQLAGDLPGTTILPVYREDASGENYLLSDYLLHMDGSNFDQYQTAMQAPYVGQPSATWPTPVAGETVPPGYPGWTNGNLIGQNGSDNEADYVSAASSNGAIGYVETAYAIEHDQPVASIINQSGNAVQPTSVNDATALEKAILYSDLTQNLTNVYTNDLPNAYPVSSYSYLVTPCSPSLAAGQDSTTKCSGPDGVSSFPPAKGQALGQFVAFLACAGQQKMALLGYSPLPPNLVQEDFNAIGRLNGGVEPPKVSPTDCQNPYVDGQTPLPGEPAITGKKPPAGDGSTPIGSNPGGSTTGGSNPTTSATNPSGGGTNPTGTTQGGKGPSSSSGKAGSKSGTKAPVGSSGVYKYLHTKHAAPTAASSFLRADDLKEAATSALGLSSPVIQIIIWCLVLAGAIALPVLALGRRRSRVRPTDPVVAKSTFPDPAGTDPTVPDPVLVETRGKA